MGILVFSLAAFLSLPKQLIAVYIGVILQQSGSGTKSNSLVSGVVLSITVLVTLLAAWYIYRELNRVKPIVIYERRKARYVLTSFSNTFISCSSTYLPRQVKMSSPVYGAENNSASNLYSNAESGPELPLSVMPQRPRQFSFTKPLQEDSNSFVGQGGYVPKYDEPKHTEVVGWETRGPRVDDMRDSSKWAAAGGGKAGEAFDDGDSSEGMSASHHTPTLRPPPPPPPTDRQRQPPFLPPNPFEPSGR